MNINDDDDDENHWYHEPTWEELFDFHLYFKYRNVELNNVVFSDYDPNDWLVYGF